MHLKRLISAAILLPLLYLYITELPPVYYAVLMLVVSTLALWEFCSMYRVKGALKYTGIVFGALILAGIYVPGSTIDIFILPFLVVVLMRLLLKKNPSSSLSDIAPVIIGLIYIPGLLGYQIGLREEGPEWIIFLYGCIWGADSFAYYIGKGTGKRKLYMEVSPNKTVAGAVGSVTGGILSAVIIKALVIQHMPLSITAAFGAIIGVVTIASDLVESMFKRDAGVKDSGSLIPGHGGVLDKIDGAVFAGPVLYWMLILLG